MNFGKLPSGDLEGSFLIFESHRFMSHTGVRKLELAEANDAISLASLRKMAEALDCELHYALIPRTSLAQQLQARAEVVVTERMRPILHTMALEDQTFQDAVSKFQFESSVKDLIEGSRRECWEKTNISQGEEWASRQKREIYCKRGSFATFIERCLIEHGNGREHFVRVIKTLVWIHLFPNGNGRHARMMADHLIIRLGRPRLSWGSASLETIGSTRARYLAALRAADQSEYRDLIEFARS